MPSRVPPKPLYLARSSYRQRRLRDTARMLPIAGAILWIMPLVVGAPRTGTTGIYLFFVWLILIIIAAGISAKLRDEPEKPENMPDPVTPELR